MLLYFQVSLSWINNADHKVKIRLARYKMEYNFPYGVQVSLLLTENTVIHDLFKVRHVRHLA